MCRAGKKLEPLEEVVCEVEDPHAGEVIEAVTLRKGEVRRWVGGRGDVMVGGRGEAMGGWRER